MVVKNNRNSKKNHEIHLLSIKLSPHQIAFLHLILSWDTL